MRGFKQRVSRLEVASGFGEVVFRLRNGARASIRRKELLRAVSEAVDGFHSRRAQVLLNAEKASDGNQLHHLAQALASGPVAHGEVNDEQI
jgi:hypothetical protein